MPNSLETIANEVNQIVEKNIHDPTKWGEATYDSSTPAYVIHPNGDPSRIDGSSSLSVLGRYGNWMGDAYGAGRYSPALKWDDVKFDLTTEGGLDLLYQEIKLFSNTGGARGIYWEDPAVGVRDAADALARSHDLLYQDANLIAANKYYEAGLKYHDENDPINYHNRESLVTALERAKGDQTAAFRAADVWFLTYGKSVVADHPYGIALKNLVDVAFGLMADAYYVSHIDKLPTDEIVDKLGERFGSSLGGLIAGDGWLVKRIAPALGKEIGLEIAKLVSGREFSEAGKSLLEFAGSNIDREATSYLGKIIEEKIGQYVTSEGGLTAKAQKNVSHLLLAAAAQSLKLDGIEGYLFTESGEDISSFLVETINDPVKGESFESIFDSIDHGVNFDDIALYFVDLAIKYTLNDFVTSVVSSAKSLVSVDSQAEQYFATVNSMAASVVGNVVLPYLGGVVGETVGYILGSLEFEILDYVSGGWLADNLSPDPVGYTYASYNTDTRHFEIQHPISDIHWDKNGASRTVLTELKRTSEALTGAYLKFVNDVLDSVGGHPSLDRFSMSLEKGTLLNYATIGYYHGSFQVMRKYDGDKYLSNDPQEIVQEAIRYQLKNLQFAGGDIVQLRAIDLWKNDPASESENSLGVLSANMEIAKEYRAYLENTETINYIMKLYPESAFTLGWIATLSQIQDLGLNQSYRVDYSDSRDVQPTNLNDIILTADGNDIVAADSGDDQVRTYGGNDTVYAGGDRDFIEGGGGNDEIWGEAGDDSILGELGEDLITGGQGADSVNGGLGTDTASYYASLSPVTIALDGSVGIGGDADGDRLYNIEVVFGSNFDDIISGAGGNDTIFGNEGRDTLIGNVGDDYLYGGGASDSLQGNAGKDRIFGYDGDDDIGGGDDSDILSGEAGNDIINGEFGDDAVFGGDGSDRLLGGDGKDYLKADDGNDQVSGDGGDDTIYADGGDDLVFGNDGNDLINGGDGSDTVESGEGNDKVYGYGGNDLVWGGAGNDLLFGVSGDDSIHGGVGIDKLYGDTGLDLLDGEQGDDEAYGGAGNDRLNGGAGNDHLVGGDDNDEIKGGIGDDVLYGDAEPNPNELPKGDDQVLALIQNRLLGITNYGLLYFGEGYTLAELRDAPHDMLIINPARTINYEQPSIETLWSTSEVDQIKQSGKLLIGYVDTTRVNTWQIPGIIPPWLGEKVDLTTYLADFNMTAWQDYVKNRVGMMIEQGFDGTLLDDVGDFFTRDRDGRTNGTQTLSQIQENAIVLRDFILDIRDFADKKIVEKYGSVTDSTRFKLIVNGAPYLLSDALGGGEVSTVLADPSSRAYLSAIDAILSENYFSTGYQAAIDQTVALYGRSGVALLSIDTDQSTREQKISIYTNAVRNGFLPYTTESASYEVLNDTFLNILNMKILATHNDFLDGGAGSDTMTGGSGDDVYVVDNFDDWVIEDVDSGVDSVHSSISYVLRNHFENLILIGGTAALNGTGNAADNGLTGNDGANVLTGDVGNDTLRGGLGRDTLLGGVGNDSLDGGSNPDSMVGGDGDDTYVLAVGSDVLVETGGTAGGIDTVIVDASYTLLASFENLVIGGNADADGIGNAAANRITGNGGANLLSGLDAADTLMGDKGNDTLVGGLGADALTGGKGKDAFRFASAAEGGDTITDYAGKDDRFEVSASGFGGGLVNGVALTAFQYVKGNGAAATHSSGQFLYDTAAKTLSWDADGTGAGAAVLIATFTSVRSWGIGEISVIA